MLNSFIRLFFQLLLDAFSFLSVLSSWPNDDPVPELRLTVIEASIDNRDERNTRSLLAASITNPNL